MAILDELVLNKGVIFGDNAEPDTDIYSVSSTQEFLIGTSLVYGDGRKFRYSRAGGAVGKALMTQQAVVDTKLTDIVQTGHAQVVGATNINVLVTTGATLVDDELAGGFLVFNQSTTGTALGDIYKIVASKLRATDTILDLTLETPIRTAVDVDNEMSIIPNRQSNVVVYPAAATGAASGVALVDVADNEYFWAQVSGVAPIIVDTAEAVVIGDSVGSAAATAVPGACGVRVTLEGIWGNVMYVGAAAEPALINVKLT